MKELSSSDNLERLKQIRREMVHPMGQIWEKITWLHLIGHPHETSIGKLAAQ